MHTRFQTLALHALGRFASIGWGLTNDVRCGAALLLCSAISATFTPSIHAAPGDLDPTFNPTGPLPGTLLRPPMSTYYNSSRVLTLSDGKLLFAGTRGQDTPAITDDFEIWRYNPDGSPDTTFGNAGLILFSVNSVERNDYVADAAILPDGRFVVGGTCRMLRAGSPNSDFCLVRFHPNGSIDSAFGSQGVITAEISAGADSLSAIALQGDGKIVAAGTCSAPTPLVPLGVGACVARFLENGELDSAFANNGKFTQQLASLHFVESVALQTDGGIVISGQCYGVFSNEACVARLTPSGALDTTFNSTGNRQVSFPGYDIDSVTSLLIQPDGRILVGTDCYDAITNYMCIAKLNANGSYAGTFGINGRAVVGGGNSVSAMSLQTDGKLVVSGYCAGLFCVTRFFDDGNLDLAFGSGGTASVGIVTGAGSENVVADIAIDRQGKIVMAGQCLDSNAAPAPNDYRLCVARVEAGTSAARTCNLDIDGDGQVFSTTDALIMSRAGARVAGSAIIGGITFPANATRNTWPLVRDYLVRQCGMNIAS